MSPLALDVGTVTTRMLATGGPTLTIPTPPDRDLATALRPHGPYGGRAICVVPDSWWAGTTAGILAHEALHQRLTWLGDVAWLGRAAAIGAQAGILYGPGRYVLCDAGFSAATFAVCEIGGGTVRVERTWAVPEAGAHALISALTPDPVERAELITVLARDAGPASATLGATLRDRNVPIYRLGSRAFTAGDVLDAFAPAAAALATTDVSAGRTVLTGAFGEFPPLREALADHSHWLGPDAAVRGAYAFGQSQWSPVPREGGRVRLHTHRFVDGLPVEHEIDVQVRPGAFAELDGLPVELSSTPEPAPDLAPELAPVLTVAGELPLELDGVRGTLPLPPLTGRHRFGLRGAPDQAVALLLTGPPGHRTVPLTEWRPS